MPGVLFGTFGVILDAFGVTITRVFGAGLLGFAVLLWYGRSTEEPGLQRAVVATMFTYFALSTIFMVLAQLSRVLNVMGWGNVVLHLVLAVWFGFYLFKR